MCGDYSQAARFGPIDLILTDPPYGLSGERRFAKQDGRIGDAEFGPWNRDEGRLFRGLFALAARALRPGGSLVTFLDRLRVTDFVRLARGLRARYCL